MFLVLLFHIIFPTDSLETIRADTLQVKSIMFQNNEAKQTKAIRYQHSQGFFCDFEDKINEKRKININLGVGNQ